MHNQQLPPGSLAAVFLWVKANAVNISGVCAGAGLATLITLRDGKGWRDCLYAGGICGVISMGVINSLEMFGMGESNAVLAGVVIGGMGVERCLSILRMFASMKTNTPPLDDKDQKNDK